MGNWLPLVRFSPACIGTVLLDGYRSLFFLLLQVPSSEQCLRRLLCRRRQKKKESKRNPPIAVLTSEPLHSSFFPQQGHFHTSSWQNIKHNKKVPLLLRGGNKSLIYYTGKRAAILSRGFLWSIHCAPSQSFTDCGNQANKRR